VIFWTMQIAGRAVHGLRKCQEAFVLVLSSAVLSNMTKLGTFTCPHDSRRRDLMTCFLLQLDAVLQSECTML
jgi:hypothetical protein